MSLVRNNKSGNCRHSVLDYGLTLIIKNPQKKIPVDFGKIKKTVRDIVSTQGLAKTGEINISFIGDGLIKKLNSRFHGCDFPTDVLAFDLSSDKKRLCADIYISADTAVRNSKIFRTDPVSEIYLYVIHGLLHIAGYDDHLPRDIRIMRGKEEFYLNRLKCKSTSDHSSWLAAHEVLIEDLRISS